MRIVEVHKGVWSELVARQKYLSVVLFTREGIKSCKNAENMMEKLASELPDDGDVRFFKVDVDCNVALTFRNHVMDTPSVLFIKDTRELSRLVKRNVTEKHVRKSLEFHRMPDNNEGIDERRRNNLLRDGSDEAVDVSMKPGEIPVSEEIKNGGVDWDIYNAPFDFSDDPVDASSVDFYRDLASTPSGPNLPPRIDDSTLKILNNAKEIDEYTPLKYDLPEIKIPVLDDDIEYNDASLDLEFSRFYQGFDSLDDLNLFQF